MESSFLRWGTQVHRICGLLEYIPPSIVLEYRQTDARQGPAKYFPYDLILWYVSKIIYLS